LYLNFKTLFGALRSITPQEIAQNKNNHKCSKEMCPNVHGFIVKHEKTSKYFLRCIEINSIALADEMILLSKFRSLLVMTNILSILLALRLRFDFCHAAV
jgi:hypothetical protein